MSFTAEHLRCGTNGWIQDNLSVHWVSDEEIMEVILTDGSKSEALAVRRMIFWRMRNPREKRAGSFLLAWVH